MLEVTPGEGELIADTAERHVELLAELDAVHATLSRFAAGRDGADLHVHRSHHDVFVVLEGSLTLRTAEGEMTVPAGTIAALPPMVVHGFRNAGAADVWYVNLHLPGTGFGDYMRGLRDGVKVPFDQHDPPDEGVRPPRDIHASPSSLRVGDVTVALARDGTVTVGDRLRINPRR